jgi:hypothetical protein
MDIEKRNLFNKLRFQWKVLRKEFDDICSIKELAFSEFYEKIMIECKKNKLKNPFDQQKTLPKKTSNIYDLDETKKIFRKVATLSHPDKNNKNESIFKDLIESKKTKNINRLFDSAKKLKIEIKEVTYDHIRKMEEEILDLQKEIQETINSSYWIWYHENQKSKQKIISNIIQKIKND